LSEICERFWDLPKDGKRDARDVSRYELLVGRWAGDEHLFQNRRRKWEAQKRMDQIREEMRVKSLPRRPLYEEPGSVSVPRFVFSWLEDSTDNEWTIAHVGLLVTLLGMWENRSSAIIPGSRFEEEAEELVLVVPGGWDGFRFARGRNGDTRTLDSGSVRERPALATLAKNKWFEGTAAGMELRIKLGERAQKVREGKGAVKATA
jgi:hypothetical protein